MSSGPTHCGEASSDLSGALSDLAALERPMTEMFDGFWPVDAVGDGTWSPLVDIEDSEDAWTIEADLPGVPKAEGSRPRRITITSAS